MIKSFVISISEIDDAELALEELSEQLAAQTLLKNSIGIVSVNDEYLNSGVYEAVAKAAPFPIMGMSAYAQNFNGTIETFAFSILVLTSDNCTFTHGVSDIIPETGDASEPVRALYETLAATAADAKLALLYAPFLPQQCSGTYLKVISEINDKLPIFGSLASSEVTRATTDTRALYCEQVLWNRLVIILISGDVIPQFYIGSVNKKAVIMPEVGVVTESHNNIVTAVSDSNINEFLGKIGFKDGAMGDEGGLSFVMIAEEKDEDGNVISSATRGLLLVGDGFAAFGGTIPVGTVLSLAATTKEVITETATDVLSQIKAQHSGKTALLYSCLGRQIALLDEPMMEYELIGSELRNSGLNYIAAVSGGEICPILVADDHVRNMEHNQTLIACVI